MNVRIESGLTLLELLIALAISGILLAIAAPPLGDFLARHRMETAVQQLYSTLKLARSEAIYRNRVVTLCPLGNNNQCTSAWNQPATLFVDTNLNATLDNEEPVIRVTQPVHDLIQVSWRNNGTYVRFLPGGVISVALTGTMKFCSMSHPQKLDRAIVVSRMGRVRKKSENVGCS